MNVDEIDLIRELRASLPEAGPEQIARARQTLLERITAEESVDEHQSTSPRKGRRWHVRRRGLGVAAAGSVALAVALLIVSPGGGGSQSAAAAVLRRVAAVAAAQTPGQVPKPGQYAYTRSRGADLNVNFAFTGEHPTQPSWSFLIPYLRQTWIAPNGTGRLRETDGPMRFLSARDRAAWVADGSHQSDLAGRQTTDQTFGKRSYPSLSKLPTDPSELRRVIEARKNKVHPCNHRYRHCDVIREIAGPPAGSSRIPVLALPGQSETFVIIGKLLGETYAPPAVRSALYQVAAELPGVKLLGQVKDPVGRTGIGVAYRDERHGQEHELIFDPNTSALLAERDVLLDPKKAGLKAPAGTIFGYATYLRSGVVDSTSSVPTR